MRKAIVIAAVAILLSGVAIAQNKTVTGTLSAASPDCSVLNSCVTLNKSADDGTVSIHISPGFSGVLQFEGVIIASNWTALQCFPLGGGAGVTSIQTNGDYQCPSAALSGVRVRMSNWVAGFTSVTLQGSAAAIPVSSITGSVIVTESGPVSIAPSGIKALLLPCNTLRRTNCQ